MDSNLNNLWLLLPPLLFMLVISSVVNAGLIRRLLRVRKHTEQKLAHKAATLAMLSHEIRNPLAGVVAVARALGNTSLDDTQRQLLDTLDDSGHALLTLLDNTLQQSQLEATGFRIETQDFALHSLVKRLITLLEPQARSKGLVLSTEIDGCLPAILHGDAQRIRQILLNLLANAIKFTDSGIVKLLVEKTGQTGNGVLVDFRVIDSGIGIATAAQAKLFTPFNQAPAIGPRFGGTGLGLSISRQLARAMAGDILVQSEESRGSIFTLQLTLPAQQLDSCQLYSLPTANPAPTPRPRSLRLLVVDDSDIHRLAAQALLEGDGHRVTTACTAFAALSLLQQQPQAFDCVLMDVHMPALDGVTAIRHISNLNSGRPQRPALIALSAWLQPDQIESLLAGGADAVCGKPLDPRALQDILGALTINRSDTGEMTVTTLSRQRSSRIC